MNSVYEELADYRRRVAAMYAAVRDSTLDPAATCQRFRESRDQLFRTHPQSALSPERRSDFTGLRYFDYDPAYRFVLIAISFFALGGYVAIRAAIDLASRTQPDSSAVGIGVAALSLVVMPFLARMKRRAGEAMGSATVLADSNQTQLCAYLSAILLGGLILNATVGWWWADPVAAIAIAALAINEGRQAWRGETCEAC